MEKTVGLDHGRSQGSAMRWKVYKTSANASSEGEEGTTRKSLKRAWLIWSAANTWEWEGPNHGQLDIKEKTEDIRKGGN